MESGFHCTCNLHVVTKAAERFGMCGAKTVPKILGRFSYLEQLFSVLSTFCFFLAFSKPKISEDSLIVVQRPYERFRSLSNFSEDKRSFPKTSKEVSKMFELTHETE